MPADCSVLRTPTILPDHTINYYKHQILKKQWHFATFIPDNRMPAERAFYCLYYNGRRVMEVKKDWLSGVLKVLLCFSFVYLWVMALGYVKKSYCGIPGAAVFLIAALLDGILVWCVWKKKKLKS